jgi:hypothetical protein
VFIDLFSRKVVEWDLNKSLSAVSTCNAFKKYLYRNNNPKGYWYTAIVESNMHRGNSGLYWNLPVLFRAWVVKGTAGIMQLKNHSFIH